MNTLKFDIQPYSNGLFSIQQVDCQWNIVTTDCTNFSPDKQFAGLSVSGKLRCTKVAGKPTLSNYPIVATPPIGWINLKSYTQTKLIINTDTPQILVSIDQEHWPGNLCAFMAPTVLPERYFVSNLHNLKINDYKYVVTTLDEVWQDYQTYKDSQLCQAPDTNLIQFYIKLNCALPRERWAKYKRYLYTAATSGTIEQTVISSRYVVLPMFPGNTPEDIEQNYGIHGLPDIHFNGKLGFRYFTVTDQEKLKTIYPKLSLFKSVHFSDYNFHHAKVLIDSLLKHPKIINKLNPAIVTPTLDAIFVPTEFLTEPLDYPLLSVANDAYVSPDLKDEYFVSVRQASVHYTIPESHTRYSLINNLNNVQYPGLWILKDSLDKLERSKLVRLDRKAKKLQLEQIFGKGSLPANWIKFTEAEIAQYIQIHAQVAAGKLIPLHELKALPQAPFHQRTFIRWLLPHTQKCPVSGETYIHNYTLEELAKIPGFWTVLCNSFAEDPAWIQQLICSPTIQALAITETI